MIYEEVDRLVQGGQKTKKKKLNKHLSDDSKIKYVA